MRHVGCRARFKAVFFGQGLVRKRSLFDNPVLAGLAGFLLNAYGEVVRRTSICRIQVDPAAVQLVRQDSIPVIFVLWHCQVFFMPLIRLYARQPLAVLLSSHRDARIAGIAARLRGFNLVQGSSTRGGTLAYRQLLLSLQRGQSVCITPDGPKGPPRQVKAGVIQLARHSGCAVVPVGLACSRRRHLRSWDRTILPLPFGRGVLLMGSPMHFDDVDGLEHQRSVLTAALNRVVDQANAVLAAR